MDGERIPQPSPDIEVGTGQLVGIVSVDLAAPHFVAAARQTDAPAAHFKLPLQRRAWRMASITIRNLDDDVKTRLRVRAADNGRSMEEEARLILRDVVGRKPMAYAAWRSEEQEVAVGSS